MLLVAVMQYLTEAEAIRRAIAHYKTAKTLWLDTEVADYQTEPKLSLIQILDDSSDRTGEQVTILDVLHQPELVEEFVDKIMLDSTIEKVFHNASYDLQFLSKKAPNVTCTLKMVANLPYYLVPLPNRQLKTLAEHLCHFEQVDSTEQTGDWGQRPLSDRQLLYAKMDPVYVAQVHHQLLHLSELIEPDPESEDIAALTLRYRQIEERWKQVNTEMEHLKKRLKQAMEIQAVSEVAGFKLSNSRRTKKKVSFTQLAAVVEAVNLDVDFPIELTKEIQKQLAEVIEQLPIEEETTTYPRLTVKEAEADELPF